MEDKVAIVAGTTGIVGLSLVRKLIQDKWKVYGISRRKQEFIPEQVIHVAVDLTDKEACKAALASCADVRYAFYASWKSMSNEEENCQVNASMVENFIDSLPSKIKHVALVTGTKHYVGPFSDFQIDEIKLPFRESLPRLEVNNFYYNQEDVLFERAKKLGFTWSVSRPCNVIGFAPFNIMNCASAIAVYATICKHLNLPFVFPGSKEAFNTLTDASDAGVLAEHLIWQASTPSAANEAFNVVNGDITRWRFLWPAFAKYFNMSLVEPADESSNVMAMMMDKEPVWREIVEKYGLKKTKMSDLATWWFLMFNTNATSPFFSDMTKSRERGFLIYKSTEKSYTDVFNELRAGKYIPSKM